MRGGSLREEPRRRGGGPRGWGSWRPAIFSAFSHSAFPLPGCMALGHGGATSPKSHEAGDLEASCGARARGGWGWLRVGSPTPTCLLAALRAEFPAALPMKQAGAHVSLSGGLRRLLGSGGPSSSQEPAGPTSEVRAYSG